MLMTKSSTFTISWMTPEDLVYDKWYERWRADMASELASHMIAWLVLALFSLIVINVLPYFFT